MFEIGKPYRTRSGNEVRLYALDGHGNFPIHGAIRMNDGEWHVMSWRYDGKTVATKNSFLDILDI